MINTINELLFQQGEGVIYLDRKVSVINANSLAVKFFKRADGVLNRLGKLGFVDKEAHSKVLSRIATGNEPRHEDAIFARRIGDQSPYKIKVAMYRDDWSDDEVPKPHALLLVSETDKSLDFPTWVFSDYYHLTPSELALAKAVFMDQSLQAYAVERGVKITTVRWTLDNVFSKTYTHSQAELKSLAIKFAI